MDYYEDRSSKLPKTNNQIINKGNLRVTLPADPASDVSQAVDGDVDKLNDSSAAAEHHLASFPADVSRHDFPVVAGLDEDLTKHQIPARSESPPKTDIVSSTLENNMVESVPVKEEVCFCVYLPCFCLPPSPISGIRGHCYAVAFLDP